MCHPRRTVAFVLILASLGALLSARRAQTVPLYAARTGLLCESCHFDPNGGGPRKEFGFAFARNRHRVEPEDTTSRWHDLDIGNRLLEYPVARQTEILRLQLERSERLARRVLSLERFDLTICTDGGVKL